MQFAWLKRGASTEVVLARSIRIEYMVIFHLNDDSVQVQRNNNTSSTLLKLSIKVNLPQRLRRILQSSKSLNRTKELCMNNCYY